MTLWTNENKSSTSWSNTDKSTTNWGNTDKSSTSWDLTPKSATTWSEQIAYLLQEIGDFLLQENGYKLIIEPSAGSKNPVNWNYSNKH